MAYPDNYEDCPPVIAVLDSVEVVDYDRIQGMVDTLGAAMCQCSEDASAVTDGKLDNLASNTNQLLITLGEEINENQSIIESKTGNTRMFL